jgi:Bax protein
LIFISIILSSVILIGYEGHDVYVDYLRNLIDSKTSELETKNKELEAKLSEIDKLNNEVESRSLLLDELAKSKDVTRYTIPINHIAKFRLELIKLGNKINSEILEERNLVLNNPKSPETLKILQKYNITSNYYEEVDLKIRPIPLIQLVAQASLESGNGTSKVFKDNNNAFGLMDGTRAMKFNSLENCVRFYAKNLNTHQAYHQYRELRSKDTDINVLIKSIKSYADDPNYVKLLNELKTSL